MATNWLQLLKNYIGTEGATSLADKLTVARAGYIDNINNADISTIPNISTLSVARIGYIDNINQVGLLQVTAVRAGYLDNINNANLSTIPDISSLSAARIGYLDELAAANLPADIAAIPTTAMRGTENAATVADGWDAALATILDNFTAARIGYLDELDFDLQTAIAAIPTDAMRGTNSAALASSWTAALATALASYTAVRGGYLDELAAANLPADIDAITAAGPTKAEMDTAHGLLATEAKQDIIDTNVDQIEVLVGNKVAGRAQIKSTTESLNQAAGSYDLMTGTTQAVILESLTVKMPTGAAGGALTSISIQTDDATPGVIIDATDGVVANLTSEAGISWTGALLINTGTKIQLTIAGGAHGSAYICTVIAKYRAVVTGGNLA